MPELRAINGWKRLYNSPFLPGLLSTRLFQRRLIFQKNAQMYYSLTTFVKSLRVSKLITTTHKQEIFTAIAAHRNTFDFI
jgi:hypothetical protein